LLLGLTGIRNRGNGERIVGDALLGMYCWGCIVGDVLLGMYCWGCIVGREEGYEMGVRGCCWSGSWQPAAA
jgi:hypothetical protein